MQRSKLLADKEKEIDQREKTTEVLVNVTQDLAKSHKEEMAALAEVCICVCLFCAVADVVFVQKKAKLAEVDKTCQAKWAELTAKERVRVGRVCGCVFLF